MSGLPRSAAAAATAATRLACGGLGSPRRPSNSPHKAPYPPCFARGFLLAEPLRLRGFPRRRKNPGLPPPAIYAGSAAKAVIRLARRLCADLSGRRAPERQREPKAGVARTKGRN